LIKINLPDHKPLSKDNFEDFNKTMDEIVIQLDLVENVKYDKLKLIKTKNEELSMIQKHI